MIGEIVVAVARRLNFVRETQGPNKGIWVGLFQRFTGGKSGDSWCMDFACYVMHIAYEGRDPFIKSGACQDVFLQAIRRGLVVDKPNVGDLFFYVNDAQHAHHVGFITDPAKRIGIAGNTSEDGKNSNGDGVYEHEIGKAIYVRLPDKRQ